MIFSCSFLSIVYTRETRFGRYNTKHLPKYCDVDRLSMEFDFANSQLL